eukprot:TRINITY_DN7674_c0_g1_i1.p1 TRINITY_DN7674_c0_g1~~TRINITY_DN7674_c0_g1_i1.p1  ORF type:complete len:171 (-),score=46.77 TRINITY_DN7674_c0_g1_i1:33-545(-)
MEQRDLSQLYEKTKLNFPQMKKVIDVEMQDVQRLISGNTTEVVLVDIREEEERRVSGIPGSISQFQFEENLKRDLYIYSTVIFYCTIGIRSGIYAEKILRQKEEGKIRIGDILNFKGSILAWLQQAPLIDPMTQEMTRKIHTYSEEWAIVPTNFQATFFSKWDLFQLKFR